MQAQNGRLISSFSSLLAARVFAGQQPIALEDKQTFLECPLHAQPVKSVTKAESDAGAASNNSGS